MILERSALAISSVRSQARKTSSVGLKLPQRRSWAGESFSVRRRYVGLEASWVMSCQALSVNSKSGGAFARHPRAVSGLGGW